MNRTDTIEGEAWRIWAETLAWVSSHSILILIGLVAGAAIIAALMTARWTGLRICRADPSHMGWRTVVGRVLEATRFWFILTLAIRVVFAVGQAPEPWARATQVAFIVAMALQAAIWARELAIGLLERRAGGVEESSSLGSAIGIIRLLVSVAIFAVALVVVLDNLGVNVTGLIAGLGIGGIAIGLAAQGIFKDLFAALAIIFDRPFRRGDAIKFEQVSGHVEEIGLKSTRIRADTGEQVVVSNAQLLDKELHNFQLVARRRVSLPFSLAYQTLPKTCAEVPEMVRSIVEQDNRAKLVRCALLGFAEKGIEFETLFDVPSADMKEVAAVRGAIGFDILTRFYERGIAFAAPDGKPIGAFTETNS